MKLNMWKHKVESFLCFIGFHKWGYPVETVEPKNHRRSKEDNWWKWMQKTCKRCNESVVYQEL